MIDKGIDSITQLSSKMDVNRNTVAKVLNGQVQPSAIVMERFVLVLGIPADQAGAIFFNHNLRNA